MIVRRIRILYQEPPDPDNKTCRIGKASSIQIATALTSYEAEEKWREGARKLLRTFEEEWDIKASEITLTAPDITSDLKASAKADGLDGGTPDSSGQVKFFDDIGLAAGAASALVGQFTASLLGTDSSPLERAGVAIVSTLASIAIAAAVASATESAAGTGPAAIFTLPTFIALGLAAVAAALSGTGAGTSGKGGGGGGTGSRGPAPTRLTPTLTQSDAQGGRRVAKLRGQTTILALQQANDSRRGLT